MKRLAGLLMILIAISVVASALTRAGSSAADPPAWAAPKAMAVKRVSPVGNSQNEPNFLNNIDCNLVDYRMVVSSTMQTGCFTETAFGMIDSDSDTVIYNGTDEGLPLLPFSPNQVLAPWPRSGDLVSLSAALVSGSYISLYKDPSTRLQDQRNLLGQLTSKQLTAPPDLRLNDPAGQPLVINPQTLAFSDGGSWLVAEDVNGSFVRINLASLDVLPFAPSYIGNNGYNLLKSQVAVSHDGRYVAINNETTGEFKVYDLATCAGTALNMRPLSCQAYDYRSFVSGKVGGLQSIRHLRFVNDSLLSFEVTASNPANSGIYELAPTASITSLIDYLGLGDSYTSGEGAFDYLSGTDTADNACHLSANSYPLLLTRDLFSALGGHSVACSGAVINDIGNASDDYRGQVSGVQSWRQLEQANSPLLNSVMANFLPGYVAQQRFVSRWQPAITTVSVGGDDIGFGDIVQACVEPHVSLHPSDNTCFNTYEDRQELEQLADRTVSRWVSLYKELRAEAPGTRLYAIGYPQIAFDSGNCALNVHLNQSELEFTAELIDYLNGDIHQAAAKAGVTYVDISQALAGHRLCETASFNVAVNGLTSGKDGRILGINVLGKESYHPNALGQQLIEQAILKQTNDLRAGLAASTKPPDGTTLKKAPKTGRVTRARTPAPKLTARIVKSRKAIAIKTGGFSSGLKPKAPYDVHLDGPTGGVIGTVSSGPGGDIDDTVSVPPDTPPGGHTIDVTGENQAGEPSDTTQPIYIPHDDNDADGDGISDVSDSCPYAVNSGVDSDQDGIDDSCDPIIGPPPGPTSGDSSSSSGDAFWLGTIDSNAINPEAGDQATPALGNQTINPDHVVSKGFFKAAARKTPTAFTMPRLRVINWLPWLLLPIIIWVIVAICLAARRLSKKCVSKETGFGYNRLMNWVRRGFVGLLSLLLLVTLLGTAFSASGNLAFRHPDKIETWLNQSNFYGHFVSNAIDQAKKSAGSSEEQGSVTLSDTAVQQAAQTAFSNQLLQQSVKTFLDGNYAWLEGKTAQPNFVIDLTKAKQSFASQVGQYVQAHITSLPVCTAQQLAALGNINNVDPLNITCRPPQLSAQAEAALVAQRIQNGDNFLANPVISANNVNPNGGSQSQPYYQKYSKLPKLYQLGVKLPWIYAGLAGLSALGIFFLAPRKRRGLRRIGIVLAEAGVILVAVKFLADVALKQAEKHVFNNANVGQLQQALTDVMHRAENQVVKTYLLFGISFLLLALIILIILMSTRNRGKKPSQPIPDSEAATGQPQNSSVTPPATDLPPRPTPTGPPPPPKKRRLVQ